MGIYVIMVYKTCNYSAFCVYGLFVFYFFLTYNKSIIMNIEIK